MAEFVVIVVGVLVALALDSWVSDRSERRMEREYLARLLDDVVQNVEELRYIGVRSTDTRVHADSLLQPEFIRAAADARLTAAAIIAGNDRRPDLAQSTYRELLASGRISLVTSARVRRALGEYDRAVTESGGFWDQTPAVFTPWVTGRLPNRVVLAFLDACTTGGINEVLLDPPCQFDLGDWSASDLRAELTEEPTRRLLRRQVNRAGIASILAGGFMLDAALALQDALEGEVGAPGG